MFGKTGSEMRGLDGMLMKNMNVPQPGSSRWDDTICSLLLLGEGKASNGCPLGLGDLLIHQCVQLGQYIHLNVPVSIGGRSSN